MLYVVELDCVVEVDIALSWLPVYSHCCHFYYLWFHLDLAWRSLRFAEALLVGCQRSRLKVLHKFLVCYLGSFDVFDALSQHSVPKLFFDYKFIRDGTGLLRNGAIKPFRLTSEVLHQNFFTKVNSLPLLLLLCPAF